jgi:lysophospholipase L1-like esterase
MKLKRTLAALLAGTSLAMSLFPIAGHARVSAAATAPAPYYYLALGDSLTVGYQPDPMTSWTHGWVYQLRDMLKKTGQVELNNFGHRGECSDTFIHGGLLADCPTKDVTSPSQLAEATGFITDHPMQIRLITVEVGGNDLNGNKDLFLNSTPTQQKALLAKIFPKMGHNWGIIFATLRKACPTCEIVALNQYNPFPSGVIKADLPEIFSAYTALLRQATQPAQVRIADVYTPFVGHELTYTWIAHLDIHATTAGYTAMAAAVDKAVTAPAL